MLFKEVKVVHVDSIGTKGLFDHDFEEFVAWADGVYRKELSSFSKDRWDGSPMLELNAIFRDEQVNQRRVRRVGMGAVEAEALVKAPFLFQIA